MAGELCVSACSQHLAAPTTHTALPLAPFSALARCTRADPSYIIRSSPANASDSNLCTTLAFNCVHGAMGGYTGACAALRGLAQCV